MESRARAAGEATRASEPASVPLARILVGDALERLRELPEATVHCAICSPPYLGLRDYRAEGQLELEPTPATYVEALCRVFDELERVLRPDGTLWLVLGDSYAGGSSGRSGLAASSARNTRGGGHADAQGRRTRDQVRGLPAKSLIGAPWRVALALIERGWILRNEIIWWKPNALPSSATDRLTIDHETVFLFAHPRSRGRYFFDQEAIREPITSGPSDARPRARAATARTAADRAATRPRESP